MNNHSGFFLFYSIWNAQFRYQLDFPEKNNNKNNVLFVDWKFKKIYHSICVVLSMVENLKSDESRSAYEETSTPAGTACIKSHWAACIFFGHIRLMKLVNSEKNEKQLMTRRDRTYERLVNLNIYLPLRFSPELLPLTNRPLERE